MLIAVVLAASVTIAMLLLLLKTRLYGIALDEPNHRSLHSNLVPRTGGIAVMTGVLVAWIGIGNAWLLIIPVMALLVVSLIDDIHNLPVHWRLLTQLFVSTSFSLIVLSQNSWWAHILFVLGLTWMINLYNFMDGSNGLAGGMTLFGFASYAIAAAIGNDSYMAALNAAIVAASFVFLLFNFHPARIFLGDGGSVPLGFLAGAVGLLGWQRELWPVWFPLFVFSPFIVDASVTLLRRILRREKIWQAHCSHYYQRLIQMGWSHRKTAIAEYCLMITVGMTAIFLIRQTPTIVLGGFAAWFLVYFAIMRKIDRAWRLRSCNPPN